MGYVMFLSVFRNNTLVSPTKEIGYLMVFMYTVDNNCQLNFNMKLQCPVVTSKQENVIGLCRQTNTIGCKLQLIWSGSYHNLLTCLSGELNTLNLTFYSSSCNLFFGTN